MLKTIQYSNQNFKAQWKAPASKSYLQRILALSILSKNKTIVRNVSWCDDSEVLRIIVKQMGAAIIQQGSNLVIFPEQNSISSTNFHLGESGLAARMLSPILASRLNEFSIDGADALRQRPQKLIIDALQNLGLTVFSENNQLPFYVKGAINSIDISIDGSISSQVLTGLLMTLPLLKANRALKVYDLKSKAYIEMTLSMLKEFGIVIENEQYQYFKIKGQQILKPIDYTVEGDWSSAAFFLILGAVLGEIDVYGLNSNSLQADKKIIEILKQVGAKISFTKQSLKVEKQELKAFQFDATDCPDLFPPLVCLASVCEGKSIIKGTSRLIHKESNRAQVLKDEFKKLGLEIEWVGDEYRIEGQQILKSSRIHSHNDHRIAMAASILAILNHIQVDIDQAESINKSYPNFYVDLDQLFKKE